MKEIGSELHLKVAKLIGFGGLIPFTGCAALMYLDNATASVFGLFANSLYACVILSFVGAIHWGLTMSEDRSPYWYIWSIIPALWGWLSIIFLDIKICLISLTIAFTLAWAVDKQAYMRGLIPNWYMKMRIILTTGAVFSLLATAFAPTSV